MVCLSDEENKLQRQIEQLEFVTKLAAVLAPEENGIEQLGCELEELRARKKRIDRGEDPDFIYFDSRLGVALRKKELLSGRLSRDQLMPTAFDGWLNRRAARREAQDRSLAAHSTAGVPTRTGHKKRRIRQMRGKNKEEEKQQSTAFLFKRSYKQRSEWKLQLHILGSFKLAIKIHNCS